MEYRSLGRSGLQISALSFGSWVTFGHQIAEEVAYECMAAARAAGVNFFDNAEVYASGESERVMGRVLQKAGWKRSDLVISTKIYWGGSGPNDVGLSRKHLIEGTEAALARLGLTYVDLLFCHRPDPRTPIEETVRGMNYLISRGQAFYWGTSEWSAEQIRAAHDLARREKLIPPTMEQPQYNMFHRERVEKEYAALYRDIGLGTTIWSPLASGLLSGKYRGGAVPAGSRATVQGLEWLRDRLVGAPALARQGQVDALAALARELGVTLPQLAIAWCLRHPTVSTVITGASRPEQVEENMRSIDLLPRLTPTVLEQIEQILGNRPEAEIDWRGR